MLIYFDFILHFFYMCVNKKYKSLRSAFYFIPQSQHIYIYNKKKKKVVVCVMLGSSHYTPRHIYSKSTVLNIKSL
jgi:hypothetical protein